MTTFIALLRGINVGGHRKVPMAALRDCLSQTGLDDVRTYVQSGNIVFRSGADARSLIVLLAEAIEARFGFPVAVFVRTAAEWEEIMAANPFPDFTPASNLVVIVTDEPPAPDAMAALREAAAPGEEAQAAGGAIFLKLPDGQARSKLAEQASRVFKDRGTARNWRTMSALRDLALATGD
jgi:uncharacterized protein (DUF1697 family)